MEGKLKLLHYPLEYSHFKFICYSIIMDADSSSIVSRVALRTDDIPLGEQTVAQVTNAIHSIFW